MFCLHWKFSKKFGAFKIVVTYTTYQKKTVAMVVLIYSYIFVLLYNSKHEPMNFFDPDIRSKNC